MNPYDALLRISQIPDDEPDAGFAEAQELALRVLMNRETVAYQGKETAVPAISLRLEIEWRQHQPSAGPSRMRAYVGPHRVGNVTRSLTGKGYVPSCFLPGAAVHTTLPTEQDAMAEVERVVRLWFEAIPHLEIR